MKRAVFFTLPRVAVLALAVLGLCTTQQGRVQAQTVAAISPSPVLTSAGSKLSPEARLVDIYRLVGTGQLSEAREAARRLSQDHPNFQLAQLVYGDLLLAQARALNGLGNAPALLTTGVGAQTLAELRHESEVRLAALRERPPTGAVPTQFLALAPNVRHAIAVDASRARLYLFENQALPNEGARMRLIADYYVSVGKYGIEKTTEGDARTPLGVYFTLHRLDKRSLPNFYGAGALPINYPNILDRRRGKTGSGIWLHGTPPNQFARAPLATNGCVVLSDPDLEYVLRTVAPSTTPVVIASRLEWAQPTQLQAERQSFESVLVAWRQARTSGDLQQMLRFYAEDFTGFRGRTLREWELVLRVELARDEGRAIELQNLSYLRWTDEDDTMIVTFEEASAPNSQDTRPGVAKGQVKRQYWSRQGQEWKIIFEGTLG
ncbi:murein L,D-transpeptidase family protein [Hylemonella sp. W303a]|uniref:L,D-transpeptidase family protein n=1 Tax=Hylemonella sp. W303a TaxID=3389873 RepID=UPI00396AFC32